MAWRRLVKLVCGTSEGRAQTARESIDARAIALLLDALPDVFAIYRFGSAGTAYERAESDLDLAFLARRAEDPVIVWDLAQRVAMSLGTDVDLVDLRRASTVMAARILVDGACIHCSDRVERDAFEARALADYARLNEERRAILDDIHARRSIRA